MPLLIQLRKKIKQYKYLCHINTKIYKINLKIDGFLRKYIYNNLLGNNEIVIEILNDFENLEKLGFIFPESFYPINGLFFYLTKRTRKYIKYLLNNLFPKCTFGNKFDFPLGNMFWARVNAIIQIFEYPFNKIFKKEEEQINDEEIFGIERIWLYLVKLNGFYYKIIFKGFK